MVGCPVDGEVGEDLSDDRDELEAMTAEAAGHDDLRMVRVRADDEMLVRGHRVQTGLRLDNRTGEAGEQFDGAGPHLIDLMVVYVPVDSVRRGGGSFAEEAELDAAVGAVGRGEAVDLVISVGLLDVDGVVLLAPALEGDLLGAVGGEPVEDHPVDLQREIQFGQHHRCPRAGRDDEFVGRVGGLVGGDLHSAGQAPVVGRVPGEHFLVEVKRGALLRCDLGIGDGRLLGADVAGVRLVESERIVGRVHGGEPVPDLVGGEDLVVQVVQLRGDLRSDEGHTVRVADVDPAAELHDVPSGLLFEFPEEFVGSAEQGDIVRALEVGLTDDPGPAVGGALIVAGLEGLDAQDVDTPFCQGVGCRSSHGTGAENDDVEVLHGVVSSGSDCGL